MTVIGVELTGETLLGVEQTTVELTDMAVMGVVQHISEEDTEHPERELLDTCNDELGVSKSDEELEDDIQSDIKYIGPSKGKLGVKLFKQGPPFFSRSMLQIKPITLSTSLCN